MEYDPERVRQKLLAEETVRGEWRSDRHCESDALQLGSSKLREAKEIKTRNAKSRLEELRGITKKSSPIEYKRIGDKYVLRGVEENQKLMNIKNKKIDELNENARMLRAKLNDRIEKTVNRTE
ncbi:hypothetical protein DdX_17652 [Ditylenchus destructor]|uniref:Uncharacterized protein n=1 Tax=Ditylenchus destructor TaxID=166010 RepID=A0AAD4QYT4_9BILA|nr:hypothetical protein DdX_17652 [Ditylenchus destructor]